jgi:hypothetical protein
MECAGDFVTGHSPQFLSCVKARRPDPIVVLAANDTLGAMGAKQALAERGFKLSLITGQCTDTPQLRQRVESMCGIRSINLLSEKFGWKED